jgi:hypothetical protein
MNETITPAVGCAVRTILLIGAHGAPYRAKAAAWI